MCCEKCSYEGDPEVTIGRDWVAVQWRERGTVNVLHADGTVTERFTVPGDVAQVPLTGAPTGGAQ